MRYMIIGLGIYGSNLARDLTFQGHEVIGVDSNHARIDALKDYISTVYLLDSTEESSLSVLPLKNVDVVIVTIGEDFGASVKTVALLKQYGVKHLYARAIDSLHYSILECFNLERILTPEQRAADDLSKEMLLGSDIQSMAIDAENMVIKFKAPDYFVGLTYDTLNLHEEYGVTLIAVCRAEATTNLLGVTVRENRLIDVSSPSAKVLAGDIFTCVATRRAFTTMMKHIL